MREQIWLAQQPGLIEKYYDERLGKAIPKFAKFRLSDRNTAICPVHEDNDPSMGVIKSKKGFIYHCFGCGSAGTVVELVKRVEFRHFNSRMTERQCAEFLADLFSLDLPAVEDMEPERVGSKLRLRRERIMQASKRYSLSDFTAALPEIRENPLLLDGHLFSLVPIYKEKDS